MIYKESRTIINFEGGNIGVAGSHKGKIGLVKFEELEKPQEIGTPVENKNKYGYYPVVMAFHKPESIDVVIKILNTVKEKMIEMEEK